MKTSSENKKFPERTCVGCFQRFPQSNLIALTRIKNSSVIFSPRHEQAGRSVYLCPQLSCFNRAYKRKGKNAFEHGLKIFVTPVVAEEVEKFIMTKHDHKS